MLHIFRRYQKVIFFCVTVVIISTFVFFGTYQVLMPTGVEERPTVKYVTVDGKKISGRHMDQLMRFLKKEGMLSSQFFDSNFLNDGIVRRELIQTGVAQQLLESDPEAFRQELNERLVQEKKYVPYCHPQAPQVSARALWALFAPELVSQLESLQGATDPLSEEAIKARIGLYDAQHRFPPQFLANMLRYQERDQKKIVADPKLQRGEVALFGYRDVEEWFGPTFLERAAQLVIETASYAQQQGYRVSLDEAQAEIAYKSAQAVQSLRENMELPEQMNGPMLLQLFMREGGFDEKTLVHLYRDLMLFRQVLQDVSSSVLLDPLPFETFYAHAKEAVTVNIRQMPKPLRFTSRDELKEFECYRLALGGESEHALALPTHVDPRPELTGTRYRLYVGCVEPRQLEARVSVKETWKWEEDNWAQLQSQFAWLMGKEMLEGLDVQRRARIDAYAREQVVTAHPEWMEEAIAQVEMKPQSLFVADVGAVSPLPGITDVTAWKQALDAKDEWVGYCQDPMYIYRIVVLEREAGCLSFVEAKQSGILTSLQESVGSECAVEHVLAAIRKEHPDLSLSDDEAVAYRFYHQVMEMPEALEQFAPVQEWVTISRLEPHFLSFEQMINSKEGRGAVPGEGAYCYTVEERTVDKTLPLDKMIQANDLISVEVRRHFLEQFITLNGL